MGYRITETYEISFNYEFKRIRKGDISSSS